MISAHSYSDSEARQYSSFKLRANGQWQYECRLLIRQLRWIGLYMNSPAQPQTYWMDRINDQYIIASVFLFICGILYKSEKRKPHSWEVRWCIENIHFFCLFVWSSNIGVLEFFWHGFLVILSLNYFRRPHFQKKLPNHRVVFSYAWTRNIFICSPDLYDCSLDSVLFGHAFTDSRRPYRILAV